MYSTAYHSDHVACCISCAEKASLVSHIILTMLHAVYHVQRKGLACMAHKA